MDSQHPVSISTDEAQDVAGSVRQAIRSLGDARKDPQAWKWALLALHSALQGACVCHLTTTCPPIGAISKRDTEEWLTYLDASRDDPNLRPPRTRLLELPDLVKRVRKDNSAGGPSAGYQIKISDAELSWIKHLHSEFRNQFTHFAPMGWAIEVSGIPQFGELVARILGDIHLAGYAFRHLDALDKNRLEQDLHRLTTAARSFAAS